MDDFATVHYTTSTDWNETNRALWDERVPLHAGGSFYDLEGFRAGADSLRDFELAEVGDVTGRSLLHLQCHMGMDTLSWVRYGAARVVGLDFVAPAVTWPARSQSTSASVRTGRRSSRSTCTTRRRRCRTRRTTFSTPAGRPVLAARPPPLGETAASLVAPGRSFYLAEFHPLADVLDDEAGSRVVHDSFDRAAQVYDLPGTYGSDSTDTVNSRSVEWRHPSGEVVSALAAAGLRSRFRRSGPLSVAGCRLLAMTDLRKTVERFWATAEDREWDAFADTLAEDVVYTLPQTRERISGRERYVQFNREYPADWHLRIERIVAEPGQVVTWIHFAVGLEEMYGISFFTGDENGRISAVTDFWPEPYEPPAGREHLVERY